MILICTPSIQCMHLDTINSWPVEARLIRGLYGPGELPGDHPWDVAQRVHYWTMHPPQDLILVRRCGESRL